jgi:hypothetical protein
MSISFSILCVTDVLSGNKIIIWLSTNAFQKIHQIAAERQSPKDDVSDGFCALRTHLLTPDKISFITS